MMKYRLKAIALLDKGGLPALGVIMALILMNVVGMAVLFGGFEKPLVTSTMVWALGFSYFSAWFLTPIH